MTFERGRGVAAWAVTSAILGACTSAPPDSGASAPGPAPAVAEVASSGAFVSVAYAENIVRVIARYWDPPSRDLDRKAELLFVLNRAGDVIRYEWLERSGDEAFDGAARFAVRQAAEEDAFGPLPASFRPDSLVVTFFFDPSKK